MRAALLITAERASWPIAASYILCMPVSEDSRQGGRLEELHRAGLIWRYPHGDLKALAEACERALAATPEDRRRIYDHFNRSETVGAVVAEAIYTAGPPKRS